MNLFRSQALILTALILAGCSANSVNPRYDYSSMDGATKTAYKRVEKFLRNGKQPDALVQLMRPAKIDTIVVNKQTKTLDIYMNRWMGALPFRAENTILIYQSLHSHLGHRFKKYDVTIYSNEVPIEQLIPNYYRSDPKAYDRSRMGIAEERGNPIVQNMSKPWIPTQGLYNRNIALWSSHGWYYEQRLKRWEWQRARAYQTVEDLLPHSFVTPYIMPMLENAGANVFMPRERDHQSNEVVVDNDSPGNSYRETGAWISNEKPGFSVGEPPYSVGENPFLTGTSRSIQSTPEETASVSWVPDIPEAGEYAVFIAYESSDENVDDARYTVYHKGGETEFRVNQTMGGGTWIYLGTFSFDAGSTPESGSVRLSNQSENEDKKVTADAVRFGGGMGIIEREGSTSGRPRFVEAARYYLQYAGMPDTLVFSLNDEKVDYNDDYQSRGEWVNYLRGAPYGPNKDRSVEGLGIPVDLSLAFHTDAGYTRNDTVIGTLIICSTEGADEDRTYPDGISRLANRDLADILQTQIVEDIRAKYDPVWNRRWIWDRGYSEAYRPNVPSVLLELLSHHNFLDMKFALDPDFKFHASRSIYKGMLKFLSSHYGFEYIVQPLPVSHFQTSVNKEGVISLKWRPVEDPLEETASPDKYIVYSRIADADFNNGVLVDTPEFKLENPTPGEIYSFKVTAVNDGGESFPSEILSVCYQPEDTDPVMIVNGFDRVAPAATIESDGYLGFMDLWDQGVPDKFDMNYIGQQYDLKARSPWLDDDAPGMGASHGDYETIIIPGNTFDFPYVHGDAVKSLGRSFVSASDEAIMDGDVELTRYRYVDLILGEEKATDGPKPRVELKYRAFPEALKAEIQRYTEQGGNLLISGAYVGTDLFENRVDSSDIEFAEQVLHFKHRTNYASRVGTIMSTDDTLFVVPEGLEFNTTYHRDIYRVEAPDAIEPADTNAVTLLRYKHNTKSAAVAYKDDKTNIITMGFPFEAILDLEHRRALMAAIFEYYSRKE
ncbi:MAG: xanthan lyase [Candidatus Marinimicrobia bacterium]|nr:xanthan lyase [Candidatus Neomarinimicrobiota bacterium]MCF7903790.1 xanthan lyase [Candidatus Neomarinimicrobiota bacterium]